MIYIFILFMYTMIPTTNKILYNLIRRYAPMLHFKSSEADSRQYSGDTISVKGPSDRVIQIGTISSNIILNFFIKNTRTFRIFF